MFSETITVYCENNKKRTNTLYAKCWCLYVKTGGLLVYSNVWALKRFYKLVIFQLT
jgi:hypothetical protein